ncbi:aromatic ring-hydroxylating oxygenase subunit alpha [Mycobacterium arosiense]|nr:aromatic ring-hydroxylating dioxygenase subunit alpha [Mycobacterium arosiense]
MLSDQVLTDERTVGMPEFPPADRLIDGDRYRSREFLELERERLWPRVWQVACREEEIPTVGDYVEYTILEESVLIVRTSDKSIKGYFNACQHRGTQLKQGCGTMKSIQCPYHFWTWNLDGTIKSVTESSDFCTQHVDPEALSLAEVRVDSWGGFVFINMDPEARPLRDFLGSAADVLDEYRLDEHRFSRYRTTIIEANWKATFDAFNEIYHTQAIHPQTLRFTDFTTWRHELHGPHGVNIPNRGAAMRPDPRVGELDRSEVLAALMESMADVDLLTGADADTLTEALQEVVTMPEDAPLGPFLAGVRRKLAAKAGLDLSQFTDDEVLIGSIWSLFPNFSLAVNGSNAFIFRFRPNGEDPNSCVTDVWSLDWAPSEASAREVKREYYPDWREHDWDKLITQDLVNLPNVQAGIRSRGFRHAICGYKETTVANFHRALDDFLGISGRP